MEPTAAPKLLPHLWKSTLLSGVLALILGVLILARPGESILVAAILFGIYLLIIGVAQVFLAFSLPAVSAGERVLLFISGAAALVLALLCFRHFNSDQEFYAVLLLSIWIGIGFIFRGVATAAAGISAPHLPGRRWEIFLGVLSLLAGVVMLAFPLTSLVALTFAVGVWLIVIGVFEIVTAFGIRRTSKTLSTLAAGPA